MAFMNILRPPDAIFTKQLFRNYNGVVVYAWKRGDSFLYIGCTQDGLARITRHNVIGKIEPVAASDEIVCWFFDDWWEASAFESKLIAEYRPVYVGETMKLRNMDRTCKDVECPACKTVFRQFRWWQMFCSTQCRTGRGKVNVFQTAPSATP